MEAALPIIATTTEPAPRRGRGRESLADRIATLLRENAELRRQLDERRLDERNDLWQLAHTDALTGLGNRRQAEQRLHEELSHGARQPGYRFSILSIDVNDLKPINDRFGHAAGDAALAAVATFLISSVRAHDVCCRLGGDEFIVILPDTDPEAGNALADRLRAGRGGPVGPGARRIRVSVGAASFPGDGRDADALLETADQRMYADKRAGKRTDHPTRLPVPSMDAPAVASA